VIYVRLYRWSENGVLDLVYAVLAAEGLFGMRPCALDSMSVKAHPDAYEAPKKRHEGDRKEPQRLEHQEPCCCGRESTDSGVGPVRRNITNAEAGRLLLESAGPLEKTDSLLIDRRIMINLTVCLPFLFGRSVFVSL
jgi:hypothetical protein